MTFNSNDTENNHLPECNADLINHCEREFSTFETILREELETLEGSLFTFPEEETPPTAPASTSPPTLPSSAIPPLLQIANRIRFMLQRFSRARGKLLWEQNELKQQFKHQQELYKEIEMERDVLLQQVHGYLQTNSSLRVRLEEQRCQTGALQRQLNVDLEEQIKVLESEKEKLNEQNSEKDKKIFVMYHMLEQTTKCLKEKETEMLKLKNNENNLISSLKGDLQVALEDKTKLEEKYSNLKEQIDLYFLGKNFEGLSLKKNMPLRKSLSEGDLSCTPLQFIKKVSLEPYRCSVAEGLLSQSPFKLPDHPTALLSEILPLSQEPQQLSSHTPSLNAEIAKDSAATERKNKCAELPVHSQLNALKRGLFNVTRKLEVLKSQLISTGAIEEEEKPSENCRSLKRKANPAEETEGEGASEDPKSGFKNLKSILEDAKSLNAKLQNMREEKQKIIELSKKEAGVQAGVKKNEKFCQTLDYPEPPFRLFHSAMTALKKSMRDCEERINGHRMTANEAFHCFVSALSACVLSNFKCFHEWRRRTGPWFGSEIDANSLIEEGSNGSGEVTSPGENGGGDNLLKKRISRDGLSCMELKIQIDRLKYKIEQRF